MARAARTWPALLDPLGERGAGAVLGEAARVRHGEHGEADRDEVRFGLVGHGVSRCQEPSGPGDGDPPVGSARPEAFGGAGSRPRSRGRCRRRSRRSPTCGRTCNRGSEASIRTAVSITGATAQAGSNRSFRVFRSQNTSSISDIEARPASAAGATRSAGFEPAEDGAGLHRDAGIDEHDRHRGNGRHRRHALAGALHPRRARVDADRHVGAEAGAESGELRRCVRPSRQIRLRRRSVAAASAEPPPIPAATGQILGEVDAGRRRGCGRERPGSARRRRHRRGCPRAASSR